MTYGCNIKNFLYAIYLFWLLVFLYSLGHDFLNYIITLSVQWTIPRLHLPLCFIVCATAIWPVGSEWTDGHTIMNLLNTLMLTLTILPLTIVSSLSIYKFNRLQKLIVSIICILFIHYQGGGMELRQTGGFSYLMLLVFFFVVFLVFCRLSSTGMQQQTKWPWVCASVRMNFRSKVVVVFFLLYFPTVVVYFLFYYVVATYNL